MMHRILLLAMAASALATPALANAAISEFPAGGVVFKNAADIAIAREDLHLAIDKVTVHYDYTSDAKGTQHVTIGFPMPPVPIDGGPNTLGGDQTLDDPVNYLRFTALVNGKPVKTTLHGYATFNGQDITAELKADGIPAYLPYEDIDGIFDKMDPKLAADLVRRNIIIKEADGSYGEPQWLYQSVFEWQQDFAPGATSVDIAYTPLTGFPSDIGDSYETDPTGAYCVGDRQRQTIKRFGDKGIPYEVLTLGYITTTAKYWKGPIGEFNLTIDKEPLSDRDDLVGSETSFCNMAAMTETPTGFTWQAKDYVPDQDIAVVWYSFYNDDAIGEPSSAQ
jgi:hypothetical protein